MNDAVLEGDCLCGAAGWALTGDPGRVTACNCTMCRRYGVLWAYDYEGERIHLRGETAAYARPKPDPSLELRFCATCGGLVAWRGRKVDADGRRRMAVNIRLADPDAVADLPIDHEDGLTTGENLPDDGCRVRDLWF